MDGHRPDGGSAGILIIALAPDVPVAQIGWCIAQLFNALLAVMVALVVRVVRASVG